MDATDDDIKAAAMEANAHDFISALPEVCDCILTHCMMIIIEILSVIILLEQYIRGAIIVALKIPSVIL